MAAIFTNKQESSIRFELRFIFGGCRNVKDADGLKTNGCRNVKDDDGMKTFGYGMMTFGDGM